MKAKKQKRLENSNSSEPRAANLTTTVKKVIQGAMFRSFPSIVLVAVFAAVFTHCPSDGGGNGNGNGKIEISLADLTVAENVGEAEVMVTASAAPQADLVLEVTTGGTATTGTDYTAPAATVTIAAGETRAIISILINDDDIAEEAETITVTLSNPMIGGEDVSSQVDLTQATATVTIEIDAGDNIIAITLADETVAEGDDMAEVTVTASSAPSANLVLEVATADDTATAGNDYMALAANATVTILQGMPQATVSIPIIDDTELETAEDFTVTLSNPTIGGTGAGNQVTLATATARVTIQDDDGDCKTGAIGDSYSANPQCGGTDLADIVTLNAPNLAASALTSIDLKGGADSLTIEAGPLATIKISLGAGADRLILKGGTLAAYAGGGADDTLPAAGTAQGGTGADAFVMTDGAISGSVTGSVTGGNETDILTLSAGTISGQVLGGGGDDTVAITTLSVAATGATLNLAGTDCDATAAGLQWLCGGEGTDTLKYLAAADGGDPDWLTGAANSPFAQFEIFFRCTSFGAGGDRSSDDCQRAAPPIIGCVTGTSPCRINDAYTAAIYDGTAGADVVIIDRSTAFTTQVDTLGGNDSITLQAGTVTHYYGGDKTTALANSEVEGGSGTDEFILDGGTLSAITPSDTEGDIIRLLGGTLTPTTLNLGGGDDTLELGEGFSIEFYDDFTGSDANEYYGGTGTDTVIINGGTVTGGITASLRGNNISSEVDIFVIKAGSLAGRVNGQLGNDIIILSGGSLDISNDPLFAVGGIFGHEGDDTVIVTTANVGLTGATLNFGASVDCDLTPSNGNQWLCGGEDNDTLKYLAASGNTNPDWLFDSDDNPRFTDFENYFRCTKIDTEGDTGNRNNDICETVTFASLSAPRLQQFALAPTKARNGLFISATQRFGDQLMTTPRSFMLTDHIEAQIYKSGSVKRPRISR